jgi:hypothetical protein
MNHGTFDRIVPKSNRENKIGKQGGEQDGLNA